MITLINGGTVGENDILFNEKTYHFTQISTGEDITNEIRRADKVRIVPGFDTEKDLLRASAEKPFSRPGTIASPQDLEMLEESTTKIFGQQILNDPLAAPLETLDAGVKKVFESSGVRTILIFAALGIVAVIALKK